MSSRFSAIQAAPADAVFGIANACANDPDPSTVDLVIGAYRTEKSEPWILPVVRKVENLIVNEQKNHEYLPIDGLKEFTSASAKFVLGENSPALAEGRVCAVQAISGTGALRLGAEFLKRFHNGKGENSNLYVSDPTWSNHYGIFRDAGFAVKPYRYFSRQLNAIDMDGLSQDFLAMPENSVVVLHCSAHNPTGADPSKEQWKTIADLCLKRKLVVFFDSAYQGFASGNVDQDAFSIRLFESLGFEFMVAQSYSKNFGLYNERAGCLTMVVNDKDAVHAIRSQFKVIVRTMYSNPPHHGAHVVAKILNDKNLYQEWLGDLNTMSSRIKDMRILLHQKLINLNTPGQWDHILKQIGMFSFTGLTEKQCKYLTENFHIYLLPSGRINMCGVTPGNADYIAKGIYQTVTNIRD